MIHETQQRTTDDNAEQNCCGGCGGAAHVPQPLKKDEGQEKGKHETKHKALLWTSILAASSHIFCCVLPGMFGLFALLSGVGIIITRPGWLDVAHEVMHEWELGMLFFSGAVVIIGWAAQFYSWKNDCHDHGCHHSSCQPRKRQVGRILLLASALFVVNIAIYFGLHQN